jgi:DNA-formamidopyrimidine glycosylase
MPEGHTIHRIARRHNDLFGGGPVAVSSPQGRFDAGARRVDGRTLERVEARGKHLLYHFDGRRTIHVHLGLVGKFRSFRSPAPDPSPATRLALRNDDAVAYLTGPMKCELVDAAATESIVGHLGPDPLVAGTRVTSFAAALASDDRPIGAALLDQSVVAGVGNVYRAEVLFLCGIHPETPASSLGEEEVKELWNVIRSELRNGVDDGRIVTVRPREVGAARRRDLPKQLRVYTYKRDRRPCRRCGTEIASAEMAGRRTWWCPGCQPVG